MWEKAWPMRETLAIARGRQDDQPTLQVRLTREDGVEGRGEACGIPYEGETPLSMMDEINAVLPRIQTGVDRLALLDLFGFGGARMALDSALWDMEAKAGGLSPFAAYGLKPLPVVSAYTIGMRSLAAYEDTAASLRGYPVFKVKVSRERPLEAVAAVRRGAPNADLIVDANQSWTIDELKKYAGPLAEAGVRLLEQPIAVGAEAGLDGWASPVPLCADELVRTEADLDKAQGRFAFINIKLDKAGGLTSGMRLADAAEGRGFKLMVGCMAGSSLSMAPAMVLAQRCAFVDLDGPMLQSEDVPEALVYENGRVHSPYKPELWG